MKHYLFFIVLGLVALVVTTVVAIEKYKEAKAEPQRGGSGIVIIEYSASLEATSVEVKTFAAGGGGGIEDAPTTNGEKK